MRIKNKLDFLINNFAAQSKLIMFFYTLRE